ncbi:MAG: 5'/3'-nucleotidase SurE [Paludibacteraceae bacterium]|nr:5'/3'-nucleotidase SurE [Paludibacteraceae bacterium]
MILITNDDGYQAKGIGVVAELARQLDERVVVLAPDGARSGQSSALSVNNPIVYHPISNQGGIEVYACSGTPVDCVKLAFSGVLPNWERPKMVISGINHGSNSSINVIYSGTMGAALEGCLYGVPSVGLSICNHDLQADFSHVVEAFAAILKEVYTNGLPKGVCLNVNAPKEGPVAGMKVCRQASGRWSEEFMASPTPRGYDCYWLTGKFSNVEIGSDDTDEYALQNGYISINPVHTDMTHYASMATLSQRFLK